MSFTLSKLVTPNKVYPALGGLVLPGVSETISILYTVEAVISITDTGLCTVRYSQESDGSESPGYGYYEFTYSGSGNPLTEGEEALKKYLSANGS